MFLFITKISTIVITTAKEPSNDNIRLISEWYIVCIVHDHYFSCYLF